MKFGAVPLAQAQGAILAHSMQGREGRIAKGTVLTRAHLDALSAAGWSQITVARLEPGDVEENAAAARLARSVVPDPGASGLRISTAGAGRVNLYATGPGVVAVRAAAVEALNSVDPAITLATVPPFQRTAAGRMVATIKIISYAVSMDDLDRAGAAGAGALQVLGPRYGSASLIETQVSTRLPSAKGREALAVRLERLGLSLSPRQVVPHDEAAIADALTAAPGEVLFVLGASATSDSRDVGPEGLRRAGGKVSAFGMPVDPGNLLFFGWLGAKPVIGLPGCARSPAMNGADWVLERLICGVDLSAQDIRAMGAGGLLKEIPTRPLPRRSKG